jgi:hypothetical protein
MKKKKPSLGLTKKQRSAIVKKARAKKDLGKPGKDFKKVETKAYTYYRKKGKSPATARKIAKKVAASQFWKTQAKNKR